ncbi:MAG TPA: hypothetical protein VF803_02130 [Candidatus Paceibacterota bacterium]
MGGRVLLWADLPLTQPEEKATMKKLHSLSPHMSTAYTANFYMGTNCIGQAITANPSTFGTGDRCRPGTSTF